MKRKEFRNVFYALKIAYGADPLRALLDLFVKFLDRKSTRLNSSH